MAYVPCFACNREFVDIASFNIHFKILHKACKNYICKLCEYTHSFNMYSSFRKHLLIVHNIPQNIRTSDKAISQAQKNCEQTQQSDVESNTPSVLAECETLVPGDTLQPSVVDYKGLLLKQADLLVAKLYQHPGFPRNLVDIMVKDFNEYMSSPFFENLKDVVMLSLDPELDANIKNDIVLMFDTLSEPFSHLQTEYKRFQYFQSSGMYIPPQSYDIFIREERVKTKNGVQLQMTTVPGQFIPLRKVLTKYFELPDVLSDTLAYMKSVNDVPDWLSNFRQGSAWKRKCARYNENDIVMPVNVYFDEVEPNAALGGHCEPLGCTYIQIPTVPPEWNSRLENIFLAVLFNGNDRVLYGNGKAFKPLIEELKYLENEGITVNVPELGEVRIFLPVGLLLGDNKGLNGICGFVECFTATHFCRICKCTKQMSESMVVEDPSLIRTPASYAADVVLGNTTATGVKEKCVFEELAAFETPTDICVDEFHDTVEGVAHYSLIPVLQHFHFFNPAFISTLNSRLYVLDLGIDRDNRPPPITVDWFSKPKLKMTGAEMYLFIRLFGVLVRDLVPEGDQFYELYLLLHDIVSIVHSKGLPKDIGATLKIKVKEHHELYISLTNNTLKPKHHFLLHYIRLFDLFGPTGPLSTMRFEAKHRLLKMTSNCCMSRVNLPKTVAIKQQLAFCHRCISNASIRLPMTLGPSHVLDLKGFDMYSSFSLTLPPEIYENSQQSVAKWVDYKGTKYEAKQVLITNIDDYGLFEFSELEFIIDNGGKPLFVCSLLHTLGYYSEIRGYEVERLNNCRNWFAIPQEKLIDPFPLCMYQLPSGEKVVVLKYLL